MYTMLVFIGIGVLLGFLSGYDFWPRIGYAIMGGVFAGIAGFIAISILSSIWGGPPRYEPTRTVPLVALNDGMQTRGHMFLGSGTIKGEFVYVYYAHKVGGGLGIFSKDADDSTVYEEDRTTAVLEY